MNFPHVENNHSNLELVCPNRKNDVIQIFNHLKKSDTLDFITFGQFRLLLVYLRQYLELFILFTRMDRNQDGRLDIREFRAGAGMLACWGIEVE